jgi:hypothetical protein
MHPTVRQQLMTAKVADMYRDAEQARLARASRRGRLRRAPAGQRPVTSNPARRLARRVLSALAARAG